MVAVVGLGLAANVVQGASVPIINGSFEDPDLGNTSFVTYGTGDPSLTGWTITTGSIDHIGNYWQAAAGKQSLDMNGTGSPANAQTGTIEQTVHLTSGNQAIVHFDLAGNPDAGPVVKTLQVSLIGPLGGMQTFTFDTSFASHGNMGWVLETAIFNVLTPGDYTLQFASQDDGQFGPALDNVTMSTVPDGGLTVALLGFALVGVEGLRRKLRK